MLSFHDTGFRMCCLITCTANNSDSTALVKLQYDNMITFLTKLNTQHYVHIF